MRQRTYLVIGLALLGFGLGVAEARPGGGESYSGGGGHSSSSSGGGGHSSSSGGGGGGAAIFELIYWTLRLCFAEPIVGVPILGGAVAWLLWSAYKNHRDRDWDSGPAVATHSATDLAPLRVLDPDFSQVVFEDFAFRLFSTAHRARATAEGLATIAPYVSAAARAQLAAREPRGATVEQVIVGAQRVIHADIPPKAIDGARVAVTIEYEANVVTAEHAYFSVETWGFARDASRRSKPPGAHTFPCPNCGAPWQATASGTQKCASCGEIVDNGRFDWIVESISLASMDERGPTLTTEVREYGTDLPSYVQPDLLVGWWVFADPAVTEASIVARLRLIYDALNAAWVTNELAPIRGYVTDGLYDYLSYWTDAYRRQGLRNQLDDMRITKTEVVKLSHDVWYDAIAIRLWGTGKDYVVRVADGDVVRGGKHRERKYSEYWTLVRSAKRKGPPLAKPACGNCGAPLAIAQSGACEHCGAHVTGGEFDWVVSKIEQDDSYRG